MSKLDGYPSKTTYQPVQMGNITETRYRIADSFDLIPRKAGNIGVRVGQTKLSSNNYIFFIYDQVFHWIRTEEFTVFNINTF